MKAINLTLSTEETNLVLEVLGQLPYIQSYALINKIQQQATTQLNGLVTEQSDNGQAIQNGKVTDKEKKALKEKK